jgi:hypothetical protein
MLPHPLVVFVQHEEVAVVQLRVRALVVRIPAQMTMSAVSKREGGQRACTAGAARRAYFTSASACVTSSGSSLMNCLYVIDSPRLAHMRAVTSAWSVSTRARRTASPPPDAPATPPATAATASVFLPAACAYGPRGGARAKRF